MTENSILAFCGPTEEYPDPIPSDGSNIRKSRRHWRERSGPYHNIQQNSHTTTASDTCTISPKECIDEIGESSLDRGRTPAENCFEGLSLLAESCPYQNWTSVARERCPNPDHFHCLIDENGRIGWVCREPIWVEKDRCPVFNVVAKKLDTTSCSQTRCPPYSYRSNDVDVEYTCRYVMERESSTTPVTTEATDTNSILIALIVLIIVAISVLVAVKLFYKYRRRQRNGKRQEESNNGVIQTQEPSGFTKNVLSAFT